MDEKRGYIPETPNMSGRVVARKRGPLLLTAIAVFLVYTVWQFTAAGTTTAAASRFVPQEAPIAAQGKLVPLEAHIMSKCPDARVRARRGEQEWEEAGSMLTVVNRRTA